MRATAFIIGIVVVAVGCDKTAGDSPTPSGEAFDLNASADLVFHVFGEPGDTRMMPVLAVRDSALVVVNLDSAGWRQFDQKYFRQGQTYPTYRDGRLAGHVTVNRGMWDPEALYSLGQCRNVIPMASVSLSDTTRTGTTVLQFAMTRTDSTVRPRTTMTSDSVRAIAKRLGHAAGATVELSPEALDSLDFRALAIVTGAREHPTIVLSFIDPQGGDAGRGAGNTEHVFVVADNNGTGYAATFTHAWNGDAARAEFRAFVDHLDLTGDGVSEIITDVSVPGSETTTRVLSWRGGIWRDAFATRASWCLDAAR